ncbi:MAG: preprotein translocase subunit SecA [Bacillota bacterium]|nr:preprotein translocase subunit SecA [Bacillota bacterium]
MLGLLRNLFSSNDREIQRLRVIVDRINALEEQIQKLSNAELRAKTGEFRGRLERGETLEQLLPEAFAVVREAGRRTLNQRHYDVQLMGGIALHEGNIAEMKTGEGKTLAATAPVYLNALTGRGVHVVTVNDYLARRDAEWMGVIYRFLGLSVGVVAHELDFWQRKQAYAADVTYGTNNEFGFDYLRDNMAMHPDEMVQRELHYAIVDEVDSILIDEARTPLIISGQADQPTELYYTVAGIIRRLKPEEDYTVDEKAHTATLTEQGMDKVQKALKVDLYDEENIELNHHVQAALKAHTLYKRDVNYIVKNGEVVIVDEFTGRLMPGRRWSDGIHQAVEAKEGVQIQRESKTLATITFQNFFRLYAKLAGMTGTAATEEAEFRKIYGLNVVVIPTNKPMIRVDYPDVVYKTEKKKLEAVIEEIKECHAKGQPVLVGTRSIEMSERVGAMLARAGIKHFEILNAKNHEREADIIAQAGKYGAVTIATNMAGRGTDILLGGNPEYAAKRKLKEEGYTHEVILAATEVVPGTELPAEVQKVRQRYLELLAAEQAVAEAEREKVLSAGGLHILGTERHESRRIDNQLRGRSGRQGDPGSSRFYVSMQDELMRLFGGERVTAIMERLGWEDDLPIEAAIIARQIENAQKRVEAHNFDLRKHVLEYDDVLNQQRHAIYDMRRRALVKEDLQEDIEGILSHVAESALNIYAGEKVYPEEWDLGGLAEHLNQVLALPEPFRVEELATRDRAQLRETVLGRLKEAWERRLQEVGAGMMNAVARWILLQIIDRRWQDHLTMMDDLQEGIGLVAYGQREPLLEYRLRAGEMFKEMLDGIQEEVAQYLFRLQVSAQPPPERRPVRNIQTNRQNDGTVDGTRPVHKVKVGRNDPCPCGSGKKYKKCCLGTGKYE